MKINDYIARIKKLNACGEALKDALNYETSQELWADCKRGDRMLWLIGKLISESGCCKRKHLTLTACKCARLALQYVEKGKNDVSLDHARAAVAHAFAAAYAVYDYAHAFATAEAVYEYAYAYADADTKNRISIKCADIIRAEHPDVDSILG